MKAFIAGTLLFAAGCGASSRGSVNSVLQKKSANSMGNPLQQGLNVPVTLVNISGMADALSINHDGDDYCGFTAWSAKSADGPIAVEGRELEAFDLSAPKDWTSVGGGLREGCKGGRIISAEAYFGYIDATLSSTLGTTVVRIALGQTGPYKAGDVLLGGSAGTFSWIDGTSLVADTATRPSNAYREDSTRSPRA